MWWINWRRITRKLILFTHKHTHIIRSAFTDDYTRRTIFFGRGQWMTTLSLIISPWDKQKTWKMMKMHEVDNTLKGRRREPPTCVLLFFAQNIYIKDNKYFNLSHPFRNNPLRLNPYSILLSRIHQIFHRLIDVGSIYGVEPALYNSSCY